MAIDVEELKSLIGKTAPDLSNNQEEDENKEQPSMPPETAPAFELDDDGEEYMPVGIDGVLAASEKLLAINRGLTPTDERDSLKYQKIIRPYAMLQKSIKMDAGKVARQAMYQAAKRKNLSGITSGQFDNYVNNLLVGNPLTSPLEEINPMQLTANARRITKMGPGGLGSSQSITEEAQAIHPSQFGFISTIESPESERAGIDVRAAMGTKVGTDGRLYQKFYDKRRKKYRWLSPVDVDGLVMKLPD